MGDATAPAVTGPARSTFGVLVTFRRPDDLDRSLDAIASQSAPFDELVVVDNDPSERTRSIVEHHRGASETSTYTYIDSATNLGPAAGRSLGAQRIMARADDDDWIVFLDDDDPLPTREVVERLVASAERMLEIDPRTAGVGLRGARLERWSGRLIPVDATGVPRVDHLHGNRVPCYRVGALRRVGLFDARLFFGFEELELGMRLRKAGHRLFADGDLYDSVRMAMDVPEPRSTPSRSLDAPSLRRYYALRNRLVVLGRERLYLQAFGWALVAGVLKPAAWLAMRPSVAWRNLRLNLTAIGDACAGRLGPRGWSDGSKVIRP
jgi:glycosyltransferase involved in cell wall biosynthesis